MHDRPCLAQVTNPPIDSLREGTVMSLEMSLGPRGNVMDPRVSKSGLGARRSGDGRVDTVVVRGRGFSDATKKSSCSRRCHEGFFGFCRELRCAAVTEEGSRR